MTEPAIPLFYMYVQSIYPTSTSYLASTSLVFLLRLAATRTTSPNTTIDPTIAPNNIRPGSRFEDDDEEGIGVVLVVGTMECSINSLAAVAAVDVAVDVS